MNSSDEAALRFTLVCAMVCYLAKGREPKMEDTPAAAVESTVAVDAFAAAVRAEAVADERRRTLEWALAKAEDEVAVGDESWFQPEHGETATECTVRFIKALLAAGSVPVATPTGIVRPNGVPYTTDEVTEIFAEQQHSLSVATPEPEWHNAYDCDAGLGDIHPQFVCERPYRVATPPAEPAAQIHDANCEQQLGACCCHCQKRADVAFSHAAPSQPVTCEHGETEMHPITLSAWLGGWCPGPVSVPKESSE